MKGKVKMAVDILMTAALLFLMGYQFWGETAHEWVGAGMFALFLAHHILNGSWHKNLSRYVFAFLPIESGLALARRLHILGAYWGFLLMSLHMGLHRNMVMGAVKRKLPAVYHGFRYPGFGAGLAVALYGAWVFVKRDFAAYMFLRSEFAFMDYEEAEILFYLDYLSLMVRISRDPDTIPKPQCQKRKRCPLFIK